MQITVTAKPGTMKKVQSPHPLLDTTPRPPDAKKKLKDILHPHKPPATFDDFLPTSTSSDALVHPDRVVSNPPAPDQPQPLPRTGRFFGRFGKPAADLEQLEIVRNLKKQQQQESRQRAKDHRRAKKEALHEERARNQWLGGLAWGFDPEAGQHIKADICAQPESGNRGRLEQRQICHGEGERLLKTDATSRIWLEAGGPGNEGHFGYGLLKTRDADVLNSARRGGLKLKATQTSSDSGKGTRRSSSQASARMSRTQSSSGQRASIPQVHISKPPSPTPQGSQPSIPSRSQSSQKKVADQRSHV